MNNHKFLLKRLLTLILFTTLLLPGCDSGSSTGVSGGSFRVWIDQPPDGATIPLAPFTLRAHASREGGGVGFIGFTANNTMLGEVTTNQREALVSGDLVWNPPAAGTYLIQAYAISNGREKVISEVATVCVGRDASTDCGDPVGGITPGVDDMKVGAQPDPLVVSPNCTTGTPEITFEGYVDDLEGAIEVYINGQMINDAGESREILLALSPSGGGYLGTYQLNSDEIAFFGDGDGKIVYRLSLLDEKKEWFKESSEHILIIERCQGTIGGVIKVDGVPNPVYIGKCSKGEPMAIDFVAETDIDPSSDIPGRYTYFERMDLAYVWFDAAGTWVGTAVGAENRTAMTREGSHMIFKHHLDVNTAPSVLRSGGGTIKYRAIAVDNDNSDFLYSEVFEISILPCGTAPNKTPTRTPTKLKGITPSVTPPYVPPPLSCSDYNNNPDGCKMAGCNFWSDGYTCSANQEPPPPPSSCSDYNKDPDGCKMAGCNFWSDGYTCSENPEPPPPPPSCSDYTKDPDGCINAGCYYWKDDTCNANPEY